MKTPVPWLRCAALAASAAALLAASPARACSVCGCGDPIVEASDPVADTGQLRLALDTEWLSMSAASEGGTGTDHLDQYSLRLNAIYSPLDGLSLVAKVPLTRKRMDTDGMAGSDLTGLGDAELGARYGFLNVVNLGARRRQELAVSAGTSLPTGADDARVGGVRVDEHGQLGTGAWGPYAGLHYQLGLGEWGAFASLTGRLRTTNAFGYRYGQALLWSAHAQRLVLARLALALGVDGRFAGRDRDAAGLVGDTGGLVLAAAPGVYLDVGGGLWLALRAQLPFYSHLFGVQHVGPTVTGGVQYRVF